MKNSIIVVVPSIAGQFLGVVIARWIGMADGLGIGIGMMAGIIVGMNFLIPYFEKQKPTSTESE